MPESFGRKKLVIFDLDGTLTPSKSAADGVMVELLLGLLEKKKVAVIGGGKYSQFQNQLLSRMPRRDSRLLDFFLFPTTSNAFYRYDQGWKNVYTLDLSREEKKEIRSAFREVFRDVDYVHPKKVYGPTLEDRGTQMSFSPLGQEVVAVLGEKGIRMKEAWKKEHDALRFRMAKLLAEKLPKLEVHVGGLTTIDITRKGIDKAYGVRQIKKMLKISIRDMVFIGDALYAGGNDAAARKSGIDCVSTKGPEETKKIIKKLMKD